MNRRLPPLTTVGVMKGRGKPGDRIPVEPKKSTRSVKTSTHLIDSTSIRRLKGTSLRHTRSRISYKSCKIVKIPAAQANAREGIRQGLEDVRQGRVRPVEEFFREFEATHSIFRD
jgi:hypothetical protein